ncbi:phosphopantetheine-binding protein [Anaeromyxobacter oryzisoli]|uniref:phosphopantetheine-binding protein n=1 Tax=Anaeromyxobacter oryzisoli TaxID=2925408 RepID=UPI001F5978FF|nr:phosphopantetheine-binding protein [Anaeromyxobacter sp. SG63]
MEELEREIKQLIIESLNLQDVTVDQLGATTPLFVEGLGLDSIDALELAMEIRKRYGVRASGDEARNREIFASVRNLAAYIAANRNVNAG